MWPNSNVAARKGDDPVLIEMSICLQTFLICFCFRFNEIALSIRKKFRPHASIEKKAGKDSLHTVLQALALVRIFAPVRITVT